MPELVTLFYDIFNALVEAAVWIVGAFLFLLVVGIIADIIEKKRPFP